MAKRRKRRQVSRASQVAYVSKYLKSATQKLKYLEEKGGYKASAKAQQAKSSLRMIYRKMGLDENIYHVGKKFQHSLISNADLRVVYNAISDIRSINTKAVNKEYKSLANEYSNLGISYEESFNYLSVLSSEFHEVYSFLTYDDLKTSYKEEAGLDIKDTYIKFLKTVEDKILTEKQTEQAKKVLSKFASQLDSKFLLETNNVFSDTIKQLKYGNRPVRKTTNNSTKMAKADKVTMTRQKTINKPKNKRGRGK